MSKVPWKEGVAKCNSWFQKTSTPGDFGEVFEGGAWFDVSYLGEDNTGQFGTNWEE